MRETDSRERCMTYERRGLKYGSREISRTKCRQQFFTRKLFICSFAPIALFSRLRETRWAFLATRDSEGADSGCE